MRMEYYVKYTARLSTGLMGKVGDNGWGNTEGGGPGADEKKSYGHDLFVFSSQPACWWGCTWFGKRKGTYPEETDVIPPFLCRSPLHDEEWPEKQIRTTFHSIQNEHFPPLAFNDVTQLFGIGKKKSSMTIAIPTLLPPLLLHMQRVYRKEHIQTISCWSLFYVVFTCTPHGLP